MPDPLDRIRKTLQACAEEGGVDLPVLPRVATQVLQMATDERADAAKLSALVHQDQALAGELLKIANSAAYGGAVKIVSLQQAVTRLGLNELSEITVATCVRGRIFALPGREAEMAALWRHAVASAACAKEIARALRRNVETAFLCGLLHDVGKPVVLLVLHDSKKSRLAKLDDEALGRLMDEFSPSFGALIAANWELPDVVQAAIVHHRCSDQAPHFAEEARMTALADRLGGYVLDPEADDEDALRADPLFAALNLYPEDVDALLAKREAMFDVVDAMAQ